MRLTLNQQEKQIKHKRNNCFRTSGGVLGKTSETCFVIDCFFVVFICFLVFLVSLVFSIFWLFVFEFLFFRLLGFPQLCWFCWFFFVLLNVVLMFLCLSMFLSCVPALERAEQCHWYYGREGDSEDNDDDDDYDHGHDHDDDVDSDQLKCFSVVFQFCVF